MTLTYAVARPMLAGIFVAGGIDAIRNPEAKAKRAEQVALPIADQLHLPTDDPVTLVQVNGAVQVAAGTLLALGKVPRLAALALMGSLVPTTLAGHRWWDEDDPQSRAQQRIQFLKNLAVLGGLVLAATGSRRRRRATTSAQPIAG